MSQHRSTSLGCTIDTSDSNNGNISDSNDNPQGNGNGIDQPSLGNYRAVSAPPQHINNVFSFNEKDSNSSNDGSTNHTKQQHTIGTHPTVSRAHHHQHQHRMKQQHLSSSLTPTSASTSHQQWQSSSIRPSTIRLAESLTTATTANNPLQPTINAAVDAQSISTMSSSQADNSIRTDISSNDDLSHSLQSLLLNESPASSNPLYNAASASHIVSNNNDNMNNNRYQASSSPPIPIPSVAPCTSSSSFDNPNVNAYGMDAPHYVGYHSSNHTQYQAPHTHSHTPTQHSGYNNRSMMHGMGMGGVHHGDSHTHGHGHEHGHGHSRGKQQRDSRFQRKDRGYIQRVHNNQLMHGAQNQYIVTPQLLPVHIDMMADRDTSGYIDQLQGHIYTLAKDQHGCRWIQSMLDKEHQQFKQQRQQANCNNGTGSHNKTGIVSTTAQPSSDNTGTASTSHPSYEKTSPGPSDRSFSVQSQSQLHFQTPVSINNSNTPLLDLVCIETFPHLNELLTDSFGNYLCQKLIEYGSEEQRYAFINRISNDLVAISLNMHGTRAVQKLVETVTSQREIDAFVSSIKSSVITLIKDLNGNHVIQRCLHHFDSSNNDFIYSTISRHSVSVCTHKHGCCVMQRCIDYANIGQKKLLIQNIVANCLELSCDSFGNYIIQYILDLGDSQVNASVVQNIVGHVAELSTEKCGSNVIEKCLELCNDACKYQIIEELYDANQLPRLLQDQYANFVIQKLMNVVDKKIFNDLALKLKPHLPGVRNTHFGKRLIMKLQKKFPHVQWIESYNNQPFNQHTGDTHSHGSRISDHWGTQASRGFGIRAGAPPSTFYPSANAAASQGLMRAGAQALMPMGQPQPQVATDPQQLQQLHSMYIQQVNALNTQIAQQQAAPRNAMPSPSASESLHPQQQQQTNPYGYPANEPARSSHHQLTHPHPSQQQMNYRQWATLQHPVSYLLDVSP